MKKCILLTLLVLPTFGTLAHAQSAPSMDWSWTKAPWKEDDKPFDTARKRIFLLSKQKKVTLVLVESYKKESDKDPWSPDAQFRFAYAAYVLDKKQPRRNSFLDSAAQSLADSRITGLRSPLRPVLAYNFCRLRFLLAARDLPFRELLPAGERLLQRDPKDYIVKYYVAKLLEVDKPKEKGRKLRLINEMIKSHPKDPAPRIMLGDAYESLWFPQCKRSNAKIAIAAYKRVKAIQPQMAQVDRIADEAVARIERVQAHAEKRRPELAKQ